MPKTVVYETHFKCVKTPNQDQIGNHLSCEILHEEVSFSLSFVRSYLDIYRIINDI